VRPRGADAAIETAAHAAIGNPGTPTVVLVGLGRSAPKTTDSLVREAVDMGMQPGADIVVTRYADLRVGKDRGFVRLAPGTGEGGRVLAGQGQQALFLFRGGGNLDPRELNKIAAIEQVPGATSLSDLTFIQRAGSKAATFETLEQAGAALPMTKPVHGVAEATAAFDEVTSAFQADRAVLKKVNSLGGKDVHFVRSHEDIAKVIDAEPDADYVLQEFLPHAKDQDIRVHMVWSDRRGDFVIPDAYVRNRMPGALTPNLANGGYPTEYALSPWEREQALASARALSQDSSHPPLHVGLDLFPRRTVTASVVEENQELSHAVSAGEMTLAEATERSRDTAVIGEAASSAGTKGSVLVHGTDPVAHAMMEQIRALQLNEVKRATKVWDPRPSGSVSARDGDAWHAAMGIGRMGA
jgi:hypothetical protein